MEQQPTVESKLKEGDKASSGGRDESNAGRKEGAGGGVVIGTGGENLEGPGHRHLAAAEGATTAEAASVLNLDDSADSDVKSVAVCTDEQARFSAAVDHKGKSQNVVRKDAVGEIGRELPNAARY